MKSLVRVMLAGTLALAAAFVHSYGQDKSQRDKKMAEMMKATQPGERHKQLNTLAGSWDVVVRFKYGPGPERQGKAVSEAKWVLGGPFFSRNIRVSQVR